MSAPKRSTATLTAKVLLAGCSAAVAVGLGAIQAGLWQPTGAQRATLVATAASIAFLGSTGSAVREWRGRRAEARRGDVGFVLTSAAWAVHDVTGLDVRELGLAAYRVRREWPRPWRRVLARVYRERADRRPVTSGVTWRPGKGVIGQSVALGADVAQDVAEDSADWLDVRREGWDRVPDHVRVGLTYDEFLRVRGKYYVVVATPVIDDSGVRSRVLGCVALDGPEGSFALLGGDEVRGVLADTAEILRRFVY